VLDSESGFQFTGVRIWHGHPFSVERRQIHFRVS
jgi:hypothetical protein